MLKTVGFPSTRTGDQTIVDGNLVIATAGKGIDFSAATHAAGMTSELLNDYEEGTWTPTVIGSTSAGTATYSLRNGRYTKVGRQVFVECAVSWSAGTGTGSLYISGLPFTSSNSSTNPAITMGLVDFLALTANNTVTAVVGNNSTRIEMWQTPVGGGGANNVAYDVLALVIMSGSYTV